MWKFLISTIPVVLIFSALAFIGVHLGAKTSQYHTPIFQPLSDFTPPKLWGRESFSPDWRAGEQADVAASQHFLEKWAVKLSGMPPITQEQVPLAFKPEIVARAIPHFLEVKPFQMPQALPEMSYATNKFAALEESEAFAFAVRSVRGAVELTASVEGWQRDGQTTSAMPLSIRLMLPYLARESAGKRATKLIVKPMVLLAEKNNTWTFPQSYTMVVVADVHVGADAVPGSYEAIFTLRNAGEIVEQIPISLRVLPFKLKVNNFHAGAFGTTHDIWAGGFTGYYPEMVDMDSRYGFNLAGGFFNKGNELPFTRDPLGRIIVDRTESKFSHFDKKMSILKQYGMGDVLFWNWGGSGKFRQFLNVIKAAGITESFDTENGKRKFAEMLAAIKSVEISRGWPDIVINPYDEALKDQNATRQIIEAIPYVREISPSTRLYMTEWRNGYARHYQSSGRQLKGDKRPRAKEYDLLMSNKETLVRNFDVIGSNILDSTARAIQDKLDSEYWHYAGASTLSAATQFALGFRAWAARSESVLIWANYKGDLFNNGWTVHHALPLDPNGRKNRNTRGPVLASSRAYAVREGIDDRKYIETLRYHAWRTGAKDDWSYLQRLAKRARGLLNNPQEIGGIDNVDGELSGDANLPALRGEVKDRILHLLDLPSVH